MARVSQVLGIARQHMHEEVVLAGHVIHGDDLGEGERMLAKGVIVLARVLAQPDRHHGLDGIPEGRWVDVCDEAPNRPLSHQSPDALQATRGARSTMAASSLLDSRAFFVKAPTKARSIRSRVRLSVFIPKTIRWKYYGYEQYTLDNTITE
jgi:hypothetical protein